MVKFPLNNSTIHSDKAEANDSRIFFTLSPLTRSIREIIALGGLTVVSSGFCAETKIHPNEIWYSPGDLVGVCARDFDQDGDIDLFNFHPNVVNLLENTGSPDSPEFAPSVNYTSDLGNFNLTHLGLTDCRFFDGRPRRVDIDADGDLDLFTSNAYKGFIFTINYLRNDGTSEHPIYVGENPQQLFGLPLGSSSSELSHFFKDIDNDGDFDFLPGTGTSALGSFYENIGTPENASFIKLNESPVPLLCDSYLGLFLDLNNDGQFDFICRVQRSLTFDWVESSASGYLPKKQLINEGENLSSFFSTTQAIDIDQDGDNDIIGFSDTEIIQYTNLGTNLAPQFDKGRVFFDSPLGFSGDFVKIGADLDSDNDLDFIYRQNAFTVTYAENTGSNRNPFYEISDSSPKIIECNNSILEDDAARGPGIRFSGGSMSLVDIDSDGDLDLFSTYKPGDFDAIHIYCENIGNSSEPIFTAGELNPFGLNISGSGSTLSFGDLDGDGDQDAKSGKHFFENIGSSTLPLFSENSSLFLPIGIGADMNLDGQTDSALGPEVLVFKGLENIIDIEASPVLSGYFYLVTHQLSQVQLYKCAVPRTGRNCSTIIIPDTASEISLSTVNFSRDTTHLIALALVDSEGLINILAYNTRLQLITKITGEAAHSISISAGQLDNDPLDEFVVSYVNADGRVVAISYNQDGSILSKVVTTAGKQPSVAVGNFNETGDAYVLTYLSPDNQIITAIYKGDGTLLSQSNGEKSSYLSVIATDILSNYPDDEFVTTIIQEDGKAGLLGFSSNNNLLGKVVGNISQQPDVVSGHFPKAESIGLAASVIQSDQKPAIFFLDNVGQLLAKAVGATKASISTVIVADTDRDGIDEGILVYIDQTGLLRFETFAADGSKK